MGVKRWVAAAGLVGAGIVLVRQALDALESCPHILRDECITPPRTQANIRYMMQAFQEVMAGRQVTYWLDYGNLLGACRTGRLLPWDHDGDLCYLREDRPKLEAVASELQARGIQLELDRHGMFYQGTKVDLESWFEHGSQLCRSDPARRNLLRAVDQGLCDDFPKAWIEPLWQIEFEGQFFPCPNHPLRLLKRRYPTYRIHPRLSIPHKQKCWVCSEFWRSAYRIWRMDYRPLIRTTP